MIRHHPGRLPVLRRRRLQEGGRPLRRRAQPAGPGQDAAQRRATSSSSTSPRTTSTSTPRKSCSTRSSDYGGTLIFVSHDRYFVDNLATQGDRRRRRARRCVYPGGYEDFLYWKKQREAGRRAVALPPRGRHPRARTCETPSQGGATAPPPRRPAPRRAAQRQAGSRRTARQRLPPGRRQQRPAAAPSYDPLAPRLRPPAAAPTARRASARRASSRRASTELERRIAEKEQAVSDLEHLMASPGFYDDRAPRRPGGGRPPAPARRGGGAHGRVGVAAGGVRRQGPGRLESSLCSALCWAELAGVVLAVPLLVLIPGTLAAAHVAFLDPEERSAAAGGFGLLLLGTSALHRPPRPRRSLDGERRPLDGRSSPPALVARHRRPPALLVLPFLAAAGGSGRSSTWPSSASRA